MMMMMRVILMKKASLLPFSLIGMKPDGGGRHLNTKELSSPFH